ncbi:hypothetical protein ACLOJK_001606 [Asimina triloba]
MQDSGIAVTVFIAINIILPFVDSNQPTKQHLPAKQGNCSYAIKIQTTCAPFAGTTDAVGIRFGDLAGNLVVVKHLRNPQLVFDPREGKRKHGSLYGGFKRCAVDMFVVNGTCMAGNVCSLYVKKFGLDRWMPGWVKVLRQPSKNSRMLPISYTFYFRKFVPENVWFGFNYCGSNRGSQPQIAY